MSSMEIGAIYNLHCNTCKLETHHRLIAKHSRTYKSSIGMIFEFKYQIWACQGCDTVTLEEIQRNYLPNSTTTPDNISEEVFKEWFLSFNKENAIWTSSLFPKRMISDIHSKHFLKLNEKLVQIYEEVILSFNNDSRILCAIGLRSLLEGICADKGLKISRNLPKIIDGLKEYLPSNIVENLHSFRFMGNYAAHELEAPSIFTLHQAIDVMEDLLNFLYELEYKSHFFPAPVRSAKQRNN